MVFLGAIFKIIFLQTRTARLQHKNDGNAEGTLNFIRAGGHLYAQPRFRR